MKQIIISKEALERLYWKEELILKQIAKRFNCSQAGILKLMKEYNIPRRTKSEANKLKDKKVKISRRELERLYWKEELTLKQIAKKLNCSKQAIHCWMKKYNIPCRTTSEAMKGRIPWNKGKTEIYSEETKRKIRDAREGKTYEEIYGEKKAEETRGKISKSNKGKTKGKIVSEETREKIRMVRIGKHHTNESIMKMSGENNHMFGKHRSEKTRRKIGEAQKGEKNHNFGKHHTEEHKRKIREALKGEKCYNWLGGKSFEPYGLEFNNKLKEQIRKRDHYRCQECFRHQDELYSKSGRKYKLHIHHIDYNKKNNNPDNLISLCRSCHSQTNFKRNDWINYFKNKI